MPSFTQPFELFVFLIVSGALVAVAMDVFATVKASRRPWPTVDRGIRYMERGLLHPVAVEIDGPVVAWTEERLAA